MSCHADTIPLKQQETGKEPALTQAFGWTRLLHGAALALSLLAGAAQAQELTALARFDAEASEIREKWRGAEVELVLTQGVPWRIFTLDDPRRLIIDFREVDWGGRATMPFPQGDRIAGVRLGGFQPGWTRMVVDLAAPLALNSAGMKVDEELGQATLTVDLRLTTEQEFAAAAGAPDSVSWGLPQPEDVARIRNRQNGSGALTVVLDPGHGGIDPGAERDGETEKNLMLTFAREVQDHLSRAGMQAILTREDDSFVSLESRVAIARHAGADLFISFHADALGEGHATGATVYTLSDTATDEASAALAERHDRADLLAGVDLMGQDDTIATVLMDLARLENTPRADSVASALVLALDQAGAPLHKVPRRAAGFSVLKAPDIPSVLLEIGFLSSDRDRAHLTDPAWRDRMAAAIAGAVQAWAVTDAAAGQLIRQ